MNPSSCPPSERWQHLLAGQSPPEEQANLELHLQTCGNCQQTVESLLQANLGRLDPTQPYAPAGPSLSLPATLQSRLLQAATPPVQIAGFEILEELGSGGFGQVFKASGSLHPLVAIKVLKAELAGNAQHRQRFEREARLAASLHHENVAVIHQVGETADGRPFIVMEYVAGGTLRDLLKDVGSLPPTDAAELGCRIARGVQAAHAAGLIHRDLKPANVLLVGQASRLSQPKITDFGLARAVEEAGEGLTGTGQNPGTPEYMSPEQLRGETRIDERIDVYSLGVVFYEMLTGNRPFRGVGMGLVKQVLNDEPQPPRKLNAAVPRDLEVITLKCLAREADRRYRSAGELADDLRRWLDGKPIHARPVGRLERLALWCRRQPVLAASLCAVVLLFFVAVGTGVSAVIKDRARIKAEVERNEADRRRARARAQAQAQPLLDQAERAAGEKFQQGEALALAEALQILGDDDEPALHNLRVRWLLARQRVLTPVQVASRRVLGGSVAYSRDGRYLAVGDMGTGALHVWEVSEGERRQVGVLFNHKSEPARFAEKGWSRVRGVAFHPDDSNQLISAGTDGTLRVWNLQEEKEQRHWSSQEATPLLSLDVSVAAGDCRLVTGNPNGEIVWHDFVTLEPIHLAKAHEGEVAAVRFRPDGQQCASAGLDGTVRLWDRAGNDQGRLEWHEKKDGKPIAILDLAFSHEGRLLAAAGVDGAVCVWNLHDRGQPRFVLRGHENGAEYLGKRVRCVSFAPDGRLYSAGADGTVRSWDLEREVPEGKVLGKHEANFSDNAIVRCLAVSPEGRELASIGADGSLHLRALPTGKLVGRLDGPACDNFRRVTLSASAYHHGSDVLVTAGPGWDFLLRSWTGRTLEARRRFVEPELLAEHVNAVLPITAVAFRPDGQRFATAMVSGTLHVWDTATGERSIRIRNAHARRIPDAFTGLQRPLFFAAVSALAWHPTGEQFVSVGYDGKLRAWDARDGKKLDEWDEDPETPLAEAGLAGLAGGPSIHPTLLGKLVEPLKMELGLNRAVVCFDRTGKHLFSAGSDHLVRVWIWPKHEVVARLRQHFRPITAGVPSPDGRWLATGDEAGHVVVWDLSTREAVHRAQLRPLLPDRPLKPPVEADFSELGKVAHDQKLRWLAPVITGLAFSPDGQWLAATQGDGSLSVLRRSTGEVTYRAVGHEPNPFGTVKVNVYFTRDGQLITAGSDGSVRRWELPAAPLVLKLEGERRGIVRAAASSDGKEWAAVSSEGRLLRWEQATGKALTGWTDSQDLVIAIAYAPGNLLVVGTQRGQVLVLERTRMEVVARYKGPDGARGLLPAVSPRPVVLRTQDDLQRWLRTYVKGVSAVAVDAEGLVAASSWHDGGIDLWQLADGKHLRRCLPDGKEPLGSLVFRPGRNELASVDGDGAVFLWDVATGKKRLGPLQGPITEPSLSFSADGKELAHSGQSGPVAIWDVEAGRRLDSLVGHEMVELFPGVRIEQAPVVAHSPDGKWLASGGVDDVIRIWDVARGRLALMLSLARIAASEGASEQQAGAPPGVRCLAFSADGKRILTGGYRWAAQVIDLDRARAAMQVQGVEAVRQTEQQTGLRRREGRLAPLLLNPIQRLRAED